MSSPSCVSSALSSIWASLVDLFFSPFHYFFKIILASGFPLSFSPKSLACISVWSPSLFPGLHTVFLSSIPTSSPWDLICCYCFNNSEVPQFSVHNHWLPNNQLFLIPLGFLTTVFIISFLLFCSGMSWSLSDLCPHFSVTIPRLTCFIISFFAFFCSIVKCDGFS